MTMIVAMSFVHTNQTKPSFYSHFIFLSSWREARLTEVPSSTSSIPPNGVDQTERVPLLAQSIVIYATTVSNGDAPVNTLLQQHGTALNLAVRRDKVQREIDEAMAKLNGGQTKYVLS